ncbi:hypothetical protein GCM10009838_62940 [Catenulispora subtropica]|uniref:Uncharacterized protein n=1 Tax=Catenulispora subtropica TaxID=450798 RepID=A0ABN2SQX3_9ACTN
MLASENVLRPVGGSGRWKEGAFRREGALFIRPARDRSLFADAHRPGTMVVAGSPPPTAGADGSGGMICSAVSHDAGL